MIAMAYFFAVIFCVFGGIGVVGGVALVIEWIRAPKGWQDETGFHQEEP